MKKNVGNVDKWVRVVLGVVLLGVLLFVQSGWRWVGLLGFVALATAYTGSCPLYSLFGISTNKGNKSDDSAGK